MRYCQQCEQPIRSADVAPADTRVYLVYRNGGRIKVFAIGKAVVAGLVYVECDWSESEHSAALTYLQEELTK
jgi:hypothetical protein